MKGRVRAGVSRIASGGVPIVAPERRAGAVVSAAAARERKEGHDHEAQRRHGRPASRPAGEQARRSTRLVTDPMVISTRLGGMVFRPSRSTSRAARRGSPGWVAAPTHLRAQDRRDCRHVGRLRARDGPTPDNNRAEQHVGQAAAQMPDQRGEEIHQRPCDPGAGPSGRPSTTNIGHRQQQQVFEMAGRRSG